MLVGAIGQVLRWWEMTDQAKWQRADEGDEEEGEDEEQEKEEDRCG